MYKWKGKKIHPANVPLSGGINPGGGVNSESKDSRLGTDLGMRLGPSDGSCRVPRGSRLTPEWLAKMRIGNGFLSESERQLFVDILYEFEGAIAFDDSEMGLLNPTIEPSIFIHTVPHTL